MPIVVNEFEVVSEPAQPPAPAAGKNDAPPPLQPPALEHLLALLRARDARVRAY